MQKFRVNRWHRLRLQLLRRSELSFAGMTLSDFEARLSGEGVVVFTGSRFLLDDDAKKLVRLGAGLARRMPRLRFRVGAAHGANEAFCAGVSLVDCGRLEVIFGLPRFRRDHMPLEGEAFAVETVLRGEGASGGVPELPLSPKYLRMAMDFTGRQQVSGRPKTRVLPREGIQVAGAPKVPAAGVVLAWVTRGQAEDVATRNLHTVSVATGVPFLAQDRWEGWIL